MQSTRKSVVAVCNLCFSVSKLIIAYFLIGSLDFYGVSASVARVEPRDVMETHSAALLLEVEEFKSANADISCF